MHKLNEELDDGDVYRMDKLNLLEVPRLQDLRVNVTECCIDMTVDLLKNFESLGHVICEPQITPGRYYSAMPSVLKGICIKRYERHVKKLGALR